MFLSISRAAQLMLVQWRKCTVYLRLFLGSAVLLKAEYHQQGLHRERVHVCACARQADRQMETRVCGCK